MFNSGNKAGTFQYSQKSSLIKYSVLAMFENYATEHTLFS